MITEHRYTVFASDLVRSRQFYENRLGCTLSEIDENGFVATRDGLRVEVEGGAVRRKFSKKWLAEAGIYITLVVDDFDALLAELKERDAPFLDDVTESADGRRVTGIADPDGVLYEIREA